MTVFERPDHTSLLLLLSAVLVTTVLWTVYRGLRNPLRNVPGPALSRWSNWPFKIAVLRDNRVRYVHELHQRYGPIVRTSPNEISLTDTAAAKVVYKVGSQFVKTEWYSHFTGDQPIRNIFTSSDFHQHSHYRKLLSSSFSERWIGKMEPFIAKNVSLAITRMADEHSEQGYADVFKWFTFMATDIIGEASFGQSFEMLRTGKKDQYIKDIEDVAAKGTLRAEFIHLFRFMAKIPFGPMKESFAIVKRMSVSAEESIQRYYRQLRETPENVVPTLLTKEYDLYEEGVLPWKQLQRDALGFIVAGTDTTAITATNAVYLLSQHPDIEQQLIHEVSALPADFNDENLQQIEILQLILKETLRLRGPVGQGLPRYVPAGGSEFCGYHIPEGTVCGVQAYSIHRDPTIWAHPEVFDPSRWIEPTQEMRDSYYPWGGGSRICIGMHLANLELRHALANFYRTFEGGVKMSLAEGMSDDDMIPTNSFLQPPKGKRCLMERRK